MKKCQLLSKYLLKRAVIAKALAPEAIQKNTGLPPRNDEMRAACNQKLKL